METDVVICFFILIGMVIIFEFLGLHPIIAGFFASIELGILPPELMSAMIILGIVTVFVSPIFTRIIVDEMATPSQI